MVFKNLFALLVVFSSLLDAKPRNQRSNCPDGYIKTKGKCVALDSDRDSFTDNVDCRPQDPNSFPGALELCDQIDNNCDGNIDENLTQKYYKDNDNDGFGDVSSTIDSCNMPSGYVQNSRDCNDTNSLINPNAVEACDNIDNNCNHQVDENLKSLFYRDKDNDGFGESSEAVYSCLENIDGYVKNYQDCNDTDPQINPDISEVCDGIDNNCNNVADESLDKYHYFKDEDGDGFGDRDFAITTCHASPQIGMSLKAGDCRDYDEFSYPQAEDICGDNIDQNCDGIPDDGCNDPHIDFADNGPVTNCVVRDGKLWCWGSHIVPRPQLLRDIDTNILGVGNWKSCFVHNGQEYCWYDKNFEELHIENRLTDTTQISASGFFICRINTAKELSCEGKYPEEAYIGLGTIENVDYVDTGDYHTCYVQNGALSCFGHNQFGQLGIGNNLESFEPVKIFESGVTDISLGRQHTCAVVNSDLWCFGRNLHGEIGDGTREVRSLPVKIISGKVVSVAAGGSFTCALLEGGKKFCFGDNNYGQLGKGTYEHEDTLFPLEVESSGVEKIFAGLYYSCMVKNKKYYCSGRNTNGEVGTGGYVQNVIQPHGINWPYRVHFE